MRRWRFETSPGHNACPSVHIGDAIQELKVQIWNLKHVEQDDVEHDVRRAIVNVNDRLRKARNLKVDEIFETTLRLPAHSMLWDSDKSEVFVRHVIRPYAGKVYPTDNSRDMIDDGGRVKPAHMIHPLYYTLIDVDSWKPRINLVRLFFDTCLSSNTTLSFREAFMHSLNDELRYYFSYGLGKYIHELFPKDHPDFNYIESYLTQLSNSLHNCHLLYDNPNGTMNARVSYTYDANERVTYTYVNPDEKGNIVELSCWPGSVKLLHEKTDDRPSSFAACASALTDEYGDSPTGLFIEINVWQNTLLSQHCLYLSEYNSNFIPAQASLISHNPAGEDKNHYNIEDTDTFAFPAKLRPKRILVPGTSKWDVIVPYIESEMYQPCLEVFLKLMDYDSYDLDGSFDTPGAAVDFFYEQGIQYLMIKFDTTQSNIRRMLKIDDANDRNDYFFMVGLRYPVLFLSVEQSMHILRHKFFEAQGGDTNAWNLWRMKKWKFDDGPLKLNDPKQFPALPGKDGYKPPEKKKYNPEDYQQKPQTQLFAEFSVKDQTGREIFPHRKVITLPPSLSYQSYTRRAGYPPQVFAVDDLDDDAFIYYICKLENFESEKMWNDLQLMRVNFEVEVSKAVVAAKGVCFYTFRMESKIKYPFRFYLQKYRVGMTTWRKKWGEIHNNQGVIGSPSWHKRSLDDPDVGSHSNYKGDRSKRKAKNSTKKNPGNNTNNNRNNAGNNTDNSRNNANNGGGNNNSDNNADDQSDENAPIFKHAPNPPVRRDSDVDNPQNVWDADNETKLTDEEKTMIEEGNIANYIYIPVRRWLVKRVRYTPHTAALRESFIHLCIAVKRTAQRVSSVINELLDQANNAAYNPGLYGYSRINEIAKALLPVYEKYKKEKRQREIQEAGARKLRGKDNFKGGKKGVVHVPTGPKGKRKTGDPLSTPSSRSLNLRSLSTLCASKQYQLATTDAYYDTL